MPACPAGHSSGADDYCDVCGARMTEADIGSAPTSASMPGSASGPTYVPAPAPADAGAACPDCSAPRTGRFCEGCGYDFAIGAARPAAPPPPAPPPVEADEEPVTGKWGQSAPVAPEPATTRWRP